LNQLGVGFRPGVIEGMESSKAEGAGLAASEQRPLGAHIYFRQGLTGPPLNVLCYNGDEPMLKQVHAVLNFVVALLNV
jgi:hypothetical protein